MCCCGFKRPDRVQTFDCDPGQGSGLFSSHTDKPAGPTSREVGSQPVQPTAANSVQLGGSEVGVSPPQRRGQDGP